MYSQLSKIENQMLENFGLAFLFFGIEPCEISSLPLGIRLSAMITTFFVAITSYVDVWDITIVVHHHLAIATPSPIQTNRDHDASLCNCIIFSYLLGMITTPRIMIATFEDCILRHIFSPFALLNSFFSYFQLYLFSSFTSFP